VGSALGARSVTDTPEARSAGVRQGSRRAAAGARKPTDRQVRQG